LAGVHVVPPSAETSRRRSTEKSPVTASTAPTVESTVSPEAAGVSKAAPPSAWTVSRSGNVGVDPLRAGNSAEPVKVAVPAGRSEVEASKANVAVFRPNE
jgi:hypothetical protein